jgi:hypothetical protein
MVKNLLIALSLLVFTSLVQAQAPLSAFVDRTNITINDVITLTLRLDVALGNSRPSLNGLNQSFEQVGGLSSRSTYTNTNGNIQAWTEYSIMLRPLTTGTLTIPAFRVGTETTNPIQITVSDAAAITDTQQDDIFLRTEISKTESYVQEQLLYSIRIYYAIGFDQGAQLSTPEVENAVIQQLGSDNNYQEVLNGISYNVTERRFVIFPQQSGELTIAPVHFNASVGRRGGINRFFNNRQQVREINLTSDEHSVTVKPQPDTFDGSTWLPASALTLEETWSNEADTVEVGDAITRNVTLTATGLSSSLLPGIEYQDLQGLRFYPDQPVRSDSADRDGVVGKRSEGTAIVASQPGEFVLPEVRMPWWNTVTDRLEIATLPARTIKVLPSATQTDNNAVNPDNNPAAAPLAPAGSDGGNTGPGSNPLWMGTTALFALLWAFTTFLLLRSKQQLAYVETTGVPQPQVRMPEQASAGGSIVATSLADGATSLRVLKTACDGSNLADIRKAVLKWGQGSLRNPELLTLEQLADAFGDAGLAQQLRHLDKALYGAVGGENFSAKALYERVAALQKEAAHKPSHNDKYALRPLYKD